MSTPRSPRYREEVTRILAELEAENNQGQEGEARGTQIPPSHPQDTMQDVYVVFIRENPDLEDPQVVDSIPTAEPDTDRAHAPDLQATLSADTREQLRDEKRSKQLGLLTISFFLFLALSSILFQLYVLFHPPIATITIIPKSEQMTLTGTLQLGRVLNPITLTQSQTVPTTGHGHQDAKAATGTLTFYNGLFTSQFIAQGTVFTGSDGVQVITTQPANIPPGNPSTGYGTVTITAQAQQKGAAGNIPAGDITITINNGLLVKNNQFRSGLDERDYVAVTQADIDNAATPVKATLSESMQGVLLGQLKNGEALQTLPCTPTITPDHRPGEEATLVKVTVSETCSAIAYNENALLAKATALLTQQAAPKLGTGYSLIGTVQVSISQATATHTPHPLVFLSFHAQGTWIYALNDAEQQRIKSLIKGHTKQDALHILLSQPGVAQASIAWGDDTRLPKNTKYIHITLFIV